jgi:hypothetical protein
MLAPLEPFGGVEKRAATDTQRQFRFSARKNDLTSRKQVGNMGGQGGALSVNHVSLSALKAEIST